jgi:Macrocin-O-methyltransferase (TylF)
MPNVRLELLKRLLTTAGAALPAKVLLDAQIALNYARLGRWMRDHGFTAPIRQTTREDCWSEVAATIGFRPVLYLEFGVYEGESIKYWSKLLRHPDSRLHGFDSFEGLPESFDDRSGQTLGAFDVNGQLPFVDDLRVTFHKGWFADTLPEFDMPPHDQLVITLDADLYSSTKTVLQHLDKWIVPGTFVYFDDFAHMEHEPKAFDEYLQNTGKRFKLAFTVMGLNYSVFVCCQPAALSRL